MIEVLAPQGTPEWIAARIGVPSGSRFADVMAGGKAGAPSLTRAAYLNAIALEQVNGTREEIPVTPDMQNGTDREPMARAMYEQRTGEIVDEIGFCLHNTLKCGVSPDGLVNGNGLTEFKCPKPKTHYEYMNRKDAPPAYKWQIQGQMWVMEREWCDFASYSPAFPENAQLVVRRVYRDEPMITSLEAEIKKFLEEVEQQVQFIRNYKEAQ